MIVLSIYVFYQWGHYYLLPNHVINIQDIYHVTVKVNESGSLGVVLDGVKLGTNSEITKMSKDIVRLIKFSESITRVKFLAIFIWGSQLSQIRISPYPMVDEVESRLRVNLLRVKDSIIPLESKQNIQINFKILE